MVPGFEDAADVSTGMRMQQKTIQSDGLLLTATMGGFSFVAQRVGVD